MKKITNRLEFLAILAGFLGGLFNAEQLICSEQKVQLITKKVIGSKIEVKVEQGRKASPFTGDSFGRDLSGSSKTEVNKKRLTPDFSGPEEKEGASPQKRQEVKIRQRTSQPSVGAAAAAPNRQTVLGSQKVPTFRLPALPVTKKDPWQDLILIKEFGGNDDLPKILKDKAKDALEDKEFRIFLKRVEKLPSQKNAIKLSDVTLKLALWLEEKHNEFLKGKEAEEQKKRQELEHQATVALQTQLQNHVRTLWTQPLSGGTIKIVSVCGVPKPIAVWCYTQFGSIKYQRADGKCWELEQALPCVQNYWLQYLDSLALQDFCNEILKNEEIADIMRLVEQTSKKTQTLKKQLLVILADCFLRQQQHDPSSKCFTIAEEGQFVAGLVNIEAAEGRRDDSRTLSNVVFEAIKEHATKGLLAYSQELIMLEVDGNKCKKIKEKAIKRFEEGQIKPMEKKIGYKGIHNSCQYFDAVMVHAFALDRQFDNQALSQSTMVGFEVDEQKDELRLTLHAHAYLSACCFKFTYSPEDIFQGTKDAQRCRFEYIINIPLSVLGTKISMGQVSDSDYKSVVAAVKQATVFHRNVFPVSGLSKDPWYNHLLFKGDWSSKVFSCIVERST